MISTPGTEVLQVGGFVALFAVLAAVLYMWSHDFNSEQRKVKSEVIKGYLLFRPELSSLLIICSREFNTTMT